MKKPLLYKVIRTEGKAICKAVHYTGNIARETLCGVRLKGCWLLTQEQATCPRCKKKLREMGKV